MTTYTAITSGEVDSDSPITDTLITRLRDNPIAVAEADSSVALSLLPTVFLGTLTTTSGATQTLSSLVLTPYKFLRLTINAVSITNATYFYIGATGLGSVILPGAGDTMSGTCEIDLTNGIGTMMTLSVGTDKVGAGASGLTTASTSITVTANSGTFDAGSIRVYGVK